jgi:hypothetical protein
MYHPDPQHCFFYILFLYYYIPYILFIVAQAVVNARAAGYFCLYLIVENPDNSDSVLDIRLAAPSFGTCRMFEHVHFWYSCRGSGSMFLALPDPDPLVRGPDSSLFS